MAVIVELFTTLRSTLATTVKVALAAEASVAVLKVTVPLAPTVGVLGVQPAVAVVETKVVEAGSGNVITGSADALGPLLVTPMV